MIIDSIPPTAEAESPAVVWNRKNPYPAPLQANQKLNNPGTHRDCRHLEFSLGDSGLTYEVGDAAATLPKNDPELVDEILGILGFQADKLIKLKNGREVSLRDALTHDFDICTLSKNVIKKWSDISGHPDIKAALEDDERMGQLLEGWQIIDLLIEFPIGFQSPDQFTGILRKLQPRLYSIASSPKAHPGKLHLTVAKVEYESRGRKRKGVCSTYLCDRVPIGDTVRVFTQAAKNFKLPQDSSTDIIMVGPGTGIAPFRAFLYERKAIGGSGRNWLFFGNPHEATDYFYQEEFEALRSEGVLNRIDLAWSRDQDYKIYVQDKINEASGELWEWIDGGAHLYVCGDAVYMAGDVDKALHSAVEEHGGMTPDEAATYVEQMKTDKRYQLDVY